MTKGTIKSKRKTKAKRPMPKKQQPKVKQKHNKVYLENLSFPEAELILSCGVKFVLCHRLHFRFRSPYRCGIWLKSSFYSLKYEIFTAVAWGKWFTRRRQISGGKQKRVLPQCYGTPFTGPTDLRQTSRTYKSKPISGFV